jgi:predicted AlkP superfamily pyrophosphatase or phosphodiesterase
MCSAPGCRFIILLGTVFSFLSVSAEAAPKTPHPTVILISLDGFRADYITRGKTPTLEALAADGVRAERMIPVFPSVTMPNHQSIVTGVYPDKHGVVNNDIEDPAIGKFAETRTDPRWYAAAKPIWLTAEAAGLKTQSMLWPSTEEKVSGYTPDHWAVFDEKLAGSDRVKQVLTWLDQPAADRPDLVMLYFDNPDEAGHKFGPDSDQLNDAITLVDGWVKELTDGLAARHLSPDLIIVADHGMAPVGQTNLVVIDDLVDLQGGHLVAAGAVGAIELPKGPARAAVEKALISSHPHVTCWPKAKIPAHLHYGKNPRVPDVVCLGEVGWNVVDKAKGALFQKMMAAPHLYGNHGYDPADPTMGALFIGNGPDFKKGLVVPPFPNLDIYPMMTHLLGLKGEKGDGNFNDVKAILTR